MKPYSLLALALGIAVALPARGAQPEQRPLTGYANTSWTEKDGLPSSTIFTIVQDTEGYLWLGSPAGLVRFDGERFVRWEVLEGAALPGNIVRALWASRDGSLWIGFGNISAASRIRKGVLRNYGPSDGLTVGAILTLLEDREGTLWAGGLSGLAAFRNNQWQSLGGQHGLPKSMRVDSLYEDQRGHLWVASSSGAFRKNPKTQVFERIDAGADSVAAVVQDRAGLIWVVGRGSLRRVGSPHATDSVPRGVGWVDAQRLLVDSRGELWVGTRENGVVRVRDQKWSGQPVVERFRRSQGLTSDRVMALLEDREGNLWIGTHAGLNRLVPYGAKAVSIRPEFTGRPVRALTVTKRGIVWTGTADGLNRLSDGKSKWYSQRDGLPSASIRALHADRQGTLWVATDRGPARFVRGRFQPLHLPDGIRLDRLTAMAADFDEGLWLGDFTGLYRWTDGGVTTFGDVPGIPRRPASAAYTDSRGRVWIGFLDGGVVMHDRGEFKSYSPADGFIEGTVTVIHEDNAGAVWVGTVHGLSRFANGRFVSLTHSNGLPGNRLCPFGKAA